MNQTKPFYESRTILWAIPGIVVILNRLFDLDITEIELTQIIEASIIFWSMIIMIYWRVKAKSELTLFPKKK